MLDYDNSAFLCIGSLRGTFHSMVQFLRKFLHNYFSIDIGSCLKMDFVVKVVLKFTCI